MKKINKHAQAPLGLTTYLRNYPLDDWDQMRGNDRNAVKEVQKQLVADQGGLCCYCENSLVDAGGNGLNDFRVEHFIPKKPHNPPPNNALDWLNLRGACSGGNLRDVRPSERFTSPDHSCDVPKDNKNLFGKILDPLHDVPAFPRYFEYVEQGVNAGKMSVDYSLCPTATHVIAENTIYELHLNADRLARFRRKVIDGLREYVEQALLQGQDMEDSLSELAQVFLTPQPTGHWHPFFTCIRWYLGEAAENHLRGINYRG